MSGDPHSALHVITATVETALMLTIEQVIEGEVECQYCGKDATNTIATGADPEPDPVCWEHAASYLASTLSFGDSLWNKDAAS